MSSKNKGKRSRSPASESNNSFVKNVTSRVSGLLPATITKWFSSPSLSNANGSVPAADGSDSSTEDEGPETPITNPPPAKRMRYSHGAFNQYPPEPVPQTRHSSTSTSMDSLEMQNSHLLYSTVQSPPGRDTFPRQPNYISTPYISSEEVSNIEVINADRFERDLTYKSPHIVTATSNSIGTKRKSIFETNTPEPKKSCAHATTSKNPSDRQPSYKPALFGSPFYPGRTTYGGASASTYINHPNIRERKVAHVRESPQDHECVSMSSSARRVMDLLENYSSPLMEARRIPMIQKADCSLDSVKFPSRSSTSRSYSYKTQELPVPSFASLMQLKQRSRLMDTTRVARQIIASHSSTLSGFQLNEADSSKQTVTGIQADRECTNKLKTRLTRPSRGEDKLDLPEPVLLPTAVLKIDKDNLPKFSISVPSPQVSQGYKPPFTGALPAVPSTSTDTSITETPVRANIFQFASPVKVSQDVHMNSTAPPTFKFGSPGHSMDKPKVEKKMNPQLHSFSFDTNKSESSVIKSSTGKSSKEWKCPGCWISNKPEVEKCVCCGAKQPSGDAGATKSVKCTVCKFANSKPGAEKCINCEKASTLGHNSVPLPIPQPADPSKWKCEDCWVSNDEHSEKCACCGSRNPKLPPAAAQPPPQEKDWKCEDCWISNKSRVDKCAACGGVKPAAPAPLPVYHSPFAKPPDEKLAEIARAQKAKWECSGCLVRNDTNKTECMCCGMEREGPSKEITAKPFNFPKESNINFKFGIDPREQEAKIAKKVEETFKIEPTRKLQEPETNNNIIPTFTFTTPNKKSVDKLDGIKSTDAPKTAFTFGIPKPAGTDGAAAAAPVFGAGSSTTSVEEKPQEVPKVNFNAPAQKEAFASGLFSQKPSQDSPQKPFTSFAPSSTLVSTDEVKAAPTKPLPFPPAASSGEKAQPFAFGSGSQVFGAPAAVTTSSFSFAPAQSTLVTSTPLAAPVFSSPALEKPVAPTMTIFGGGSAPATTPAPALAQTAAPAPTHAPALSPASAPASVAASVAAPAPASSPTPAASLFSFGSNGQSAAPAPDKSKFNFSFGSAKNTEASPFGSGFKSTFGSAESSGASNTFALPAPAAQPTNAASGIGGAGVQGFGAPAQEQLWPAASNSPAMFGGADSKPAPFSFGASSPFAASTPAARAQPTPSLFGNQSQPAQQSPFGIPSQDGGQPGLFSSPQPAPTFGAQPAPGLFGTTAPPAFNATAASFEAPAQASTFNFGLPQSSRVFGFGAQTQQPQQAQPQSQQGVYNFGSGSGMGGMNQAMGGGMMNQPLGEGMMNQSMGGGLGGVQFAMGSAPSGSVNVRRVRKAVRRNPPR